MLSPYEQQKVEKSEKRGEDAAGEMEQVPISVRPLRNQCEREPRVKVAPIKHAPITANFALVNTIVQTPTDPVIPALPSILL